MNWDLLTVALLAGAANWAFRVLPMLARADQRAPGRLLERFLSASGPAAIATLFVAAILPELTPDLARSISLGVGTLAVLGCWFATRSVVIATLAAAVLHGAAVWALG
jgi:branched-subunit amino acid transport protein